MQIPDQLGPSNVESDIDSIPAVENTNLAESLAKQIGHGNVQIESISRTKVIGQSDQYGMGQQASADENQRRGVSEADSVLVSPSQRRRKVLSWRGEDTVTVPLKRTSE